jgi:hypothetical protein
MERKKIIVSELFAMLLSILFAYTAVSKVYDWYGTKKSLYNQVFPNWVAETLLYSLPIIEIFIVMTLTIREYRRLGFFLSIVLMSVFSIYIFLVLIGVFSMVPCSCGGVIDAMGWEEHLVFNLVFLGMAVWGWKWEVEKGL